MLFRIITFTNKEGARDQKGRIKYESRRREGKRERWKNKSRGRREGAEERRKEGEREKRRDGKEEKKNEKRIIEVKQTWSR